MNGAIPVKKTVGRFTFENGSISGPKQYMEEQGSALLARIETGQEPNFNATCHLSPDIITAILVWLQTDFAGWLGRKQLIDSLRTVSMN